jgi:antitoxin CptB
MSMIDKETRLRRLLYLSWHRGCKETDFLLGHFARARLSSMSEEELDLYEAFIEENDWDIYAWLTGTIEAPQQYQVSLIPSILSVVAEESLQRK